MAQKKPVVGAEAPTPKAKPGRPSRYRAEYAKQAVKLCRLGAMRPLWADENVKKGAKYACA